MKSAFLLLFLFIAHSSIAQKIFSEGTITYQVVTIVNGKPISGEVKSTQSVKGAHTRVELSSTMGKTTTIYDSRDGEGAILRDFGSQKIMIPFTKVQMESKNKKYDQLVFEYSDQSKELVGYQCRKATAQLADGTKIEVYFSKDLITDNTDIGFQFGRLPGLALEFTSINANTTVTYTASSISFEPIPIQQFDVPNSGYRILSYEESQKKK
jgi:hypothetical protein